MRGPIGGGEESCRYEVKRGRAIGHDDLSHYFPLTLTMFINMQLIKWMNDGVAGDCRWRRWME